MADDAIAVDCPTPVTLRIGFQDASSGSFDHEDSNGKARPSPPRSCAPMGALNKSPQKRGARIGMGCEADFAVNIWILARNSTLQTTP